MDVFEIKTKVYFGEGSLKVLENLKDQRVFIVTDPFMVKSGTINKITTYLEQGAYTIFSEIVPDPPIELIVSGIEAIGQFNPDIIVALGGGSAIDAAKAMMDFSKKILKSLEVQFIAIPTTSGTGSEVTSFAVITDKEKGVKYPLVSDELLPDVAILEPELVKTVPDFITADTGMDVLTHALEAYVSTNATDFSDALAEKAISLVFKYLIKSYKEQENIEAKNKMHNASCLAGMAFNLASLGINHGIAHSIGGKFHIPHGRANAMLLPHVIAYNANIIGYNNKDITVAAEKYAQVAKLVGLEATTVRIGVKNLINEIIRMQKTMGMPTTLKACGVEESIYINAREEVAKAALEDGCTKTNPRTPVKEEILEILEKIK